MALVVKVDEAANPGRAIGGGGLIVTGGAHGLSNLIEQPRRLRGGRRGGWLIRGGHGWLLPAGPYTNESYDN
jgi:hypothetical protein